MLERIELALLLQLCQVIMLYQLVVSTHLKNMLVKVNKIHHLPGYGVKIKNNSNHHLAGFKDLKIGDMTKKKGKKTTPRSPNPEFGTQPLPSTKVHLALAIFENVALPEANANRNLDPEFWSIKRSSLKFNRHQIVRPFCRVHSRVTLQKRSSDICKIYFLLVVIILTIFRGASLFLTLG